MIGSRFGFGFLASPCPPWSQSGCPPPARARARLRLRLRDRVRVRVSLALVAARLSSSAFFSRAAISGSGFISTVARWPFCTMRRRRMSSKTWSPAASL
jgi:hypothetical protein